MLRICVTKTIECTLEQIHSDRFAAKILNTIQMKGSCRWFCLLMGNLLVNMEFVNLSVWILQQLTTIKRQKKQLTLLSKLERIRADIVFHFYKKDKKVRFAINNKMSFFIIISSKFINLMYYILISLIESYLIFLR